MLFTRVVYGMSFHNVIFWVAVITAIVGFCLFHWQAYRVNFVRQNSLEAMVLNSLRGSAFTAILLSGGAALQAVQILCVYLLGTGYSLGAEFGKHLAAMIALVILTAVFYMIFWLLKLIRLEPRAG